VSGTGERDYGTQRVVVRTSVVMLLDVEKSVNHT
jgi:hypothetical protein